jgi:manganese-dependent inorganic pyrophosphatase
MDQQRTYVIGHRNPDTDSICSAIAYARLRQRQGVEGVTAARAGNLNRQTEFVLEELGVEPPPLLLDVHPRVRDVVGTTVVTIEREAPLSRALELFHLHNVRLLPVVDAERRPEGLLVLKRIAERFVVPRQEAEIRRVLASPESIRKCLEAKVLTAFDSEAVEELSLYVGAMATATFDAKMSGRDARGLVLITGDRENVQQMAVAMGVRVLIVTGNLPVSEQLLVAARENRVTVLSTPFDTATSAWLTRLSTPVCRLIKSECPSVGLQDRLEDLKLKLTHGGEPGAVVLDADGRVAAIATKSNLLAPSPVKLILVDHNELSQAVPGADKVEVLEVVDHHRLGNFHTEAPIRFINQPLGSTCTVVAGLYRQAGMDPEPTVAGLLLAGLLSDTVILKSPTTTENDEETAAWLGELAGRDPREFGRRIFAAGSALAAYPSLRELLLADFKEYTAGEKQLGISQVEVVNFHEFHSLKEKLARELAELRRERKLDLAALLVTDIVRETSLLLAVGGKELPYLIGYAQLEDHLFELPGVLSRKKQLVPHLLKVFKD